MKRLVVACVAVCAAAAPVRAQSCPAADSVVGSEVHRGGIIRRYERISDTTQMEVREEVVRLISTSPDASFRMITAWEGETPQATPATLLHIVVATDRHGDMTDQQMSSDQARLREVQSAGVLIDDNTRIRLPRASYSGGVQQANLMRGTRFLEDAAFTVTPDQLKAIANAHRVSIIAGAVRGGFSGGRITAIKELYRATVCAPAGDAATPSS